MGRRPLALVLVGLLILSALLGGCRKSAVPPIEELTPDEELTAAMEEAQENTDQAGQAESPVPTEQPTEAVEATEEPAVEPTATTAPLEQTTVEPTAEPVAEETSVPTPVVTSGETAYVVQPGDNLFRIALRYNLSVQAVAQANNITNPALILVGQSLVIPAGSASATTPPVSTSCGTVYVVQPGDNLFRIALRHNYSQYYLAQYNNISNPSVVYVGQQICIP